MDGIYPWATFPQLCWITRGYMQSYKVKQNKARIKEARSEEVQACPERAFAAMIFGRKIQQPHALWSTWLSTGFCQSQYSQAWKRFKQTQDPLKSYHNRTVRLIFFDLSGENMIIWCFFVEVFPFSSEVLTAATCTEVYERLAKDGLQPSPVTLADFVKSCVPFFVCSLRVFLRLSAFSTSCCAFDW